MSYKFNPFTGNFDIAAAGSATTPGGTDTQVQFNDGGSFGGDSGLTFNKTTNALTVGGATVTASAPVLDLSQTWNDAGVTFTGLKFNITDTASNASSLLMDLQLGGNSNFSVGKNLIEKRNGANAQTFRLYNTYTDASNYERGKFEWASNVLRIGTEKAGSGSARALEFQTNGTTRLTIGPTGKTTYNLGSPSKTNPQIDFSNNGFFEVSAGGFVGIVEGASERIRIGNSFVEMHQEGYIGWQNSTGGYSIDLGTLDTVLRRDAANTIAQRNSTNAQTFRLYNTYTDASNYERGKFEWASNVLKVGTEKAGTGSARALSLVSDDAEVRYGTNGSLYLEVTGQTTGNARGAGAFDWQAVRTNAAQVASGVNATAFGRECIASGVSSFAAGVSANASNTASVAIGNTATASGVHAVAMGVVTTASGANSLAIGRYCRSVNASQYSFGDGPGSGQAQGNLQTFYTATTDASSTPLNITGTATDRMVIPATRSCAFVGIVQAMCNVSSSSNFIKAWKIEGVITRDGNNTTRLVGTPTIIVMAQDADGTPTPSTWAIASITADDTNEALAINVTGQTGQTIRWQATLMYSQVGF